jgi:hypothetical protein
MFLQKRGSRARTARFLFSQQIDQKVRIGDHFAGRFERLPRVARISSSFSMLG